jgi:hypothetical protein
MMANGDAMAMVLQSVYELYNDGGRRHDDLGDTRL